MNKSIFLVALIAILSFLPAKTVMAQKLEGRLSLGYSDTTGNTEEEKINFDFNLSQKRSEKLSLLYTGLAHYGKSAGEINADKKSFGLTSEFVQDAKTSFYLNSGILKDRFAGYDSRLNFGAGFFKALISGEKQNLRAAAGLEVTKEDYTDDTSKTRQWLKLGLKGDRIIGENIKALSEINFGAPKANFNDEYEINYSLGALFTVNSNFDLETKYISVYRNSPLVAGKSKTDSTFITNLVYKM